MPLRRAVLPLTLSALAFLLLVSLFPLLKALAAPALQQTPTQSTPIGDPTADRQALYFR